VRELLKSHGCIPDLYRWIQDSGIRNCPNGQPGALLPAFLFMPDDLDRRELEELRALLERNRLAIESLRIMIANMEVLLASLSGTDTDPREPKKRAIRKG
jgi:hypothetical protein